MSHYVACLLQSDMMGGRPGFYICSVLSNMTKVVEFSNSCSKLNWQILVEYNEKLLVLILIKFIRILRVRLFDQDLLLKMS